MITADMETNEEMEVKSEITDCDIETTPTTIQYIPIKPATEDPNPTTIQFIPKTDDLNSTTIQYIPKTDDLNPTTIQHIPETDDKDPNLEFNEETDIKTEIQYLPLKPATDDPNPTTIQHIPKTDDPNPTTIQYIPETNDPNLEITEKIDIKTGIQYMPLKPGTDDPNPRTIQYIPETDDDDLNLEFNEQTDIKTETSDFDIESTPTTIQYIDKDPDESQKEKCSGVLECQTCSIGFLSQENYEKHMLCHKQIPDSGPTCRMCDVMFATERGFIMHCQITHDELKPTTTKSKSSEEQVEAVTNAVKVKEIAGALKRTKGESENGLGPNQFDKANIPLTTNERPERPYKCRKCNKEFFQIDTLNIHEITHATVSPYKASNGGLMSSTGLETHEINQKSISTYKCNKCDKGFTTNVDMKRHDKKAYECNLCAKRLILIDSLKNQQRINSTEKSYKCNECGETFNLICNLNRHLCDKDFSSSLNYNRHKITHTDKKPHKCNVCDQRFSYIYSLRRHEQFHKKWLYKCKMCDKEFPNSEYLKRHEVAHSGERPYKCTVCSKGFNRIDVLKSHERIHTNERPYKCKICNKGFKRSDNLRAHEKYTH